MSLFHLILKPQSGTKQPINHPNSGRNGAGGLYVQCVPNEGPLQVEDPNSGGARLSSRRPPRLRRPNHRDSPNQAPRKGRVAIMFYDLPECSYLLYIIIDFVFL